MTPSELLDHLWRHGVGADDRARLAAAAAAGEVEATVAIGVELFAAWLAADDGGSGVIDPAALAEPAPRAMACALALRVASRRRDVAALDGAMAAIDVELARLDPSDPRTATARAAVDLALAEAALLGGDPGAARRCLGRVAASGPPAFRIAALHRLVGLLAAVADLPTAVTRARQAVRLAEQLERPAQAVQSQILLGLVSYLMDDGDAMREALRPLVDGPDGATARVLMAGFDAPELVLPVVSEALQISSQRRDPLGYAIGVLVAGRACARAGRLATALATVIPARSQLRDVAPELVIAIDSEVAAWRRTWGDAAFQTAEREALAALERR
jgi:hypothetical protein